MHERLLRQRRLMKLALEAKESAAECPLCEQVILPSESVVDLKQHPYRMDGGMAHLECADEALRHILDARADELSEFEGTRGV